MNENHTPVVGPPRLVATIANSVRHGRGHHRPGHVVGGPVQSSADAGGIFSMMAVSNHVLG
jgi:hypothetical protein